MKSVAFRDLQRRWPEVDEELERAGSLVVTRDGKSTARLLRFREDSRRRAHFDAAAHMKRLRAALHGREFVIVDAALAIERADTP